jgi:hypothetical protein
MLGWKSDALEGWKETELYGELLWDAYEDLEICLLGVNGCGRRAKLENRTLVMQPDVIGMSICDRQTRQWGPLSPI